jgi:hypothetical protein
MEVSVVPEQLEGLIKSNEMRQWMVLSRLQFES